MSDKVSSADNQQGSSFLQESNPSETTRQSPLNQMSSKEAYAYLQGAMHDASLNKKKKVRFGQKYPKWLTLLRNLLLSVGVHSWMYKEGKNRNFYILETVCKKLNFAFDTSKLATQKERIAYIRGFFDAEGGIPRTDKEFYIQLVQKNFQKIKTLKQMLADLGIKCGKIHNPSSRVDPNYWRIFISRKNHKDFASIIGSWHPIKAEIFSRRKMI